MQRTFIFLIISLVFISCLPLDDVKDERKSDSNSHKLIIDTRGVKRITEDDSERYDSLYFYLFRINNAGDDAVLVDFYGEDFGTVDQVNYTQLSEGNYILCILGNRPMVYDADCSSYVRSEGIGKYKFSQYSQTKVKISYYGLQVQGEEQPFHMHSSATQFQLNTDKVLDIQYLCLEGFVTFAQSVNADFFDSNIGMDYFVCNAPKSYYVTNKILQNGQLVDRPYEAIKNQNDYYYKRACNESPNLISDSFYFDAISFPIYDNIVTEQTKDFATFVIVRVPFKPKKAMINGILQNAPATPPTDGYYIVLDSEGKPFLNDEKTAYQFYDKFSIGIVNGYDTSQKVKAINYKEQYLYFKLHLKSNVVVLPGGLNSHQWSTFSHSTYMINITGFDFTLPPAPTFDDAVKGTSGTLDVQVESPPFGTFIQFKSVTNEEKTLFS